nr:MAG TPA: hypothetical protein [Bacteriophage sp.]
MGFNLLIKIPMLLIRIQKILQYAGNPLELKKLQRSADTDVNA